jgi:hypothetical protein
MITSGSVPLPAATHQRHHLPVALSTAFAPAADSPSNQELWQTTELRDRTRAPLRLATCSPPWRDCSSPTSSFQRPSVSADGPPTPTASPANSPANSRPPGPVCPRASPRDRSTRSRSTRSRSTGRYRPRRHRTDPVSTRPGSSPTASSPDRPAHDAGSVSNHPQRDPNDRRPPQLPARPSRRRPPPPGSGADTRIRTGRETSGVPTVGDTRTIAALLDILAATPPNPATDLRRQVVQFCRDALAEPPTGAPCQCHGRRRENAERSNKLRDRAGDRDTKRGPW